MGQDIIFSESDDEQMRAAVNTARETLKFYLREWSWEKRRIIPGLDLAAVKLAFSTDKKPWFGTAPEQEHLWVRDVEFDGRVIAGTLLNRAKWVKGKKAGKPAGAPIELLADWMYVIDGRVYGGFSVDAMRRSMTVEERAQHDAAWGLDFGEPGKILLAPATKQDDDGEIVLDDSLDNAFTMERRKELAQTSHPMDINMRDGLVEALAESPDVVTEVDGIGQTMLHAEAIAGNDVTIGVLLEHGADRAAKNSWDQTPLDLAKLMGWPRVVELLES